MNSSTQETSSDETFSAKDSMYNILVDESLITWTGKELSSKLHYGTINLISGNFEISAGLISKGEFVVDMTTIINQDLPQERRARLENHLKSEDFFFVESYPEAKISISESEIIEQIDAMGAGLGPYNASVSVAAQAGGTVTCDHTDEGEDVSYVVELIVFDYTIAPFIEITDV